MFIYVKRDGILYYVMTINFFSLSFTKQLDNAKLYHSEKDAYSDMCKIYVQLLKKKEKIDDIGIQYDDNTIKSISEFAM